MSGSELLFLFLVSSLIFLLMGLALVLFVTRYQQRLISQSEELKLQEAQHQEVLLKATIDSQEKERTRMAGELHDGLGAHLSTVRLNVLMHGQEHPESQEFTENVAEMLFQGIGMVREISHDLLPRALESYGLMPALSELMGNVSHGTALQAEVNCSGTPSRLSGDRELALYRITQELVSNTLRHAQAEHLHLDLDWKDDVLIMKYRDDGVGFDMHDEQRGLGMYNIESRIHSLSGHVKVSSEIGSGMRCRVEVPLSKPLNTAK